MKINVDKFRSDIHLSKDVNQNAIAEKLGLTKGTVSSKLRRAERMPVEEFLTICAMLGTDIQDYVLDQ